MAKALELHLHHQSFQWIFRNDFLYDWLVWSPCSPRDFQESCPTPQFKSINLSVLGFLYSLTLTSIHDYWKTIALARRIFVNKVMYLLLNRLSRLAIDFLPNSKGLLISQLQTTSAVILESKKIKFLTVYSASPSIFHEGTRLNAMFLVFWMLSFNPAFSLSSFTFIKWLFSSSSLSTLSVASSAYLRLWIFLPAIFLIPACASSRPPLGMM